MEVSPESNEKKQNLQDAESDSGKKNLEKIWRNVKSRQS